jgi:hypothetical protein
MKRRNTMKQIYVCEKCGKQFDDYSEAMRCENSHAGLKHIGWEEEITKRQTWANGDRMPSKAILESDERWNNETEKSESFYGEYKLVKILTGKELEEILKEREERIERERIERERWEAEREAKKAKTE